MGELSETSQLPAVGNYWSILPWGEIVFFFFFFTLLQDATLQHYMDYTSDSLVPVMAHIARNVVKVNEGQTKHMVRGCLGCLDFDWQNDIWIFFIFFISDFTGCQGQVLYFKTDEDCNDLTAQVFRCERSFEATNAVTLTLWIFFFFFVQISPYGTPTPKAFIPFYAAFNPF